MIRLDEDLIRLDYIDLEAVAAIVVQQDEPESLITNRKLRALVTLCRHVAKRSNRVVASRLLEFIDEAERAGLRRAG